MATSQSGIWVRVVLASSGEVTGFVPGVQSPNDFWGGGKQQLVRIEKARERSASGKTVERDMLFVNRDQIALVEMMTDQS